MRDAPALGLALCLLPLLAACGSADNQAAWEFAVHARSAVFCGMADSGPASISCSETSGGWSIELSDSDGGLLMDLDQPFDAGDRTMLNALFLPAEAECEFPFDGVDSPDNRLCSSIWTVDGAGWASVAISCRIDDDRNLLLNARCPTR